MPNIITYISFYCTMNWYNIKNVASGETEVMIYDEIGIWGVDAKSFINELKAIPNDTSVLLRINSPGGSVIDGLAIYDAVNRLPNKVTSRIEGLAASMASVIALAADEVTMSENSLYMIHNVWGGEIGEADDLRKAADLMDKMSSRLSSIYVGKTGKTAEEISDMMDNETWFTSEEALEAGFIDGIESPVKLAATYDINKYNYKGKTLAVELFKNKKENKMEKQFEELKNFISDMFNKTNEPKEVKILDNEEVTNKMKEIEDAVEASASTIVELNGTIVEKEGLIETLTNEVEDLKTKLAKSTVEPNNTQPTTEPNPTPNSTPVDAWAALADNVASDNKIYLNN